MPGIANGLHADVAELSTPIGPNRHGRWPQRIGIKTSIVRGPRCSVHFNGLTFNCLLSLIEMHLDGEATMLWQQAFRYIYLYFFLGFHLLKYRFWQTLQARSVHLLGITPAPFSGLKMLFLSELISKNKTKPKSAFLFECVPSYSCL
ncbi:Hypothetical predicted protein [Podarcis lilfordi]|uniref:Uncharacterized protein n=1 Tax=Podarcis lilfordi TaxID=74358 RepID=A0AA35PJ62_9SAUR|nr:Hypothetical predicted protein [Podarcis lilfordi]